MSRSSSPIIHSSPTPTDCTRPLIHHFRICPMKEAIQMKRNSFHSSGSMNRLLSQSTFSLRSCHFACSVVPRQL
ncbi:hypothetical protein BLOT_007915 [Blomia tropicalis]|nr:hypothetical protein BLOT_007915 [Blomia tropicalis]